MKIYLASFMQPENFGCGNVISITSSSKPRNIRVDGIFLPLTPDSSVMNRYYELREEDADAAGKYFIEQYTKQCQDFVDEVLVMIGDSSAESVLPFKEGDTLCSWERAQYTNYRKILAPFLEKLGYEVVLN